MWSAALRLPEADRQAHTVHATHRGSVVTVTLMATAGRPMLAIRRHFRPSAESSQLDIGPFDLTVVDGPEPLAVAVAVGLRPVAAAGDRCRLDGHTLTYETSALIRPRAWLANLLEGLANAAECVRVPDRVEAVLRRGAQTDRDPVARARCLTVLLRCEAPEARVRVAVRALVDRDPKIRLLGATAVGALGLATLRELALDASLAAEDRIRAVDFMVRRFGDQHLLPTLVKIACRGSESVATAAVTGMARLEPASAVADALARVIRADSARAGIRNAALDGLARVDAHVSTAALIRLLYVVDDPMIIAVIGALGRVGGREAIGPLGAVTRRGGAVGRAAQRALEGVRSRVREGLGALSLASDDPGGRLSSPPNTRA